MALFQNSVLNKYLKGLQADKVAEAFQVFTSHFHNPTIQENIRNSKEEQYQGEFLIDLFVNVLGYTKNPTPNFNLTTELKNIKGSKKTDGAILKGDKALAVIELKGTNTTDLSKVETQAFGYKNNQPGCNYVITSNFEKLRFYIDNAVDFEEFNLFQLTKERFDILWLCLSSDYLLKDIPKKIKDESLTQEENVTKKLYRDYASFRNEIFDAIQNENPEYDKLTLFKKTQKLLDRFLFIFFAEDRLLLPPNSIRSIVSQWTDLRDKYDEYFPLYDRFKKYFGYMNTGHKGQQHDIFAYNGGLFAPDEILDNIKINDDLLHKHTLNLSNYDFESEVSVNILGHIFEHSLNDIDEIQAEIQGVATEQSKTKRKKDGVFYTPKYITKYIVDNTVGKLCEEKKTELNIQEAEYEKERKGRQKSTLKKLSQKLEDYRKWLLQITICDPACGSGAFLNQALEFLIAEHQYIDELQAKLFGDAMVLSEVENAILENNLFGVDINEESVEIAKLSLWLRTAQKGRKLTSLNDNIKCGNSLIDDPSVAGDKAFNWKNEFPEVFAKGGFDVIIGNPPWGAELNKLEKQYFKNRFPIIDSSTPNSYTYFMGLCYELTKVLGLVIPDSYLLKDFERTRKIFTSGINNLIWYQNSSMPDDLKPFAQVDHDVISFTFFKEESFTELIYSLNFYINNQINIVSYKRNKKEIIEPNYFNTYNLLLDDQQVLLKNKLIKLETFEKVAQVHEGIHTGNCRDKLFIDAQIRGDEKPLFYGGKNGDIINNYYSQMAGWYVDYRKEVIDKDKGEYASLRDEKIFMYPKVYITRTGNPFKCFIDKNNYASNNFFSLQVKNLEDNSMELLSVFVCILNSKFSQFCVRKLIAPRIGSSFVETKIIHLLKLPLPVNYDNNKDAFFDIVNKTVRERKALTEKILFLLNHLKVKFSDINFSKKLQNWHELDFGIFLSELEKARKKSAKENETEYSKLSLSEEAEWMQYFNEQKQKAEELKTEIDKTDKEIDQMVYDLYGLTDEEIAIVEDAKK
ncbi:Eco57I restriction-modification methylase domain-containing protein [Winogradskyella litorisediminis]|uniref:site-specific DNA-methyltransferase (adenine-specific) n=1 Tax=Winogradskyella litorisediminis TaxID=1156618 RepID=A0ABW3N806_9FLAO